MECTNPILINTVFQNENDCIGLIIFIPVITFETQTKTFKVTRSKIGQKLQFLGIFNLFLIFFKSRIVNNSANVNKVQCFRNGGIQNRNYFVNLT